MRTAPAISKTRLKAWLVSCPMRIRRWVCAGHLALIAVLSLVPTWLFPPSISRVPGIDKWAHVAMYGVLGALLRWAAGPLAATRIFRWLPVAGVAYGFLMELLQLWISGGGRSFSWADAAANLAGVVVFWGAADRFLGKDELFHPNDFLRFFRRR
mgnify:CR=1 FL=1